MPFDGKNFKQETKADPFTVEHIAQWLAQEPNREYGWAYPDSCLLAQYTRAHGGYQEAGHYVIGDRRIHASVCMPLILTKLIHANDYAGALANARRILAGRAP